MTKNKPICVLRDEFFESAGEIHCILDIALVQSQQSQETSAPLDRQRMPIWGGRWTDNEYNITKNRLATSTISRNLQTVTISMLQGRVYSSLGPVMDVHMG